MGDGIWRAVRTGTANTNYLLAFAAPNGQKVALIDLNDPGGYGYGFIVMSTQASYAQDLVDGMWLFQSNDGTAGSFTVTGSDITSPSGSATAAFGSPWTGLASLSGGGLGLLTGTGAYAYIDPTSPGYLELGLKR